jgi:hypothetical protein
MGNRAVLWTDPAKWMNRIVALRGPYQYRYVLGDTTEFADARPRSSVLPSGKGNLARPSVWRTATFAACPCITGRCLTNFEGFASITAGYAAPACESTFRGVTLNHIMIRVTDVLSEWATSKAVAVTHSPIRSNLQHTVRGLVHCSL